MRSAGHLRRNHTMAEKTKDCQEGGWPLVGGFKLFPVDARNWELCELGRGKDGSEKWLRRGRFYSYNTVGQALAYVADILLKRRATEGLEDFMAGVSEYRAIADAIEACAANAGALGGTLGGTTKAAGDRG